MFYLRNMTEVTIHGSHDTFSRKFRAAVEAVYAMTRGLVAQGQTSRAIGMVYDTPPDRLEEILRDARVRTLEGFTEGVPTAEREAQKDYFGSKELRDREGFGIANRPARRFSLFQASPLLGGTVHGPPPLRQQAFAMGEARPAR